MGLGTLTLATVTNGVMTRLSRREVLDVPVGFRQGPGRMNGLIFRSEPFPRGGDEAIFGVEVADLNGATELGFTVLHTDGDSKVWQLLGSLPSLSSRSQASKRMSGIRRTLRYEVSGIGVAGGRIPSFRLLEPIWLPKELSPPSPRAPGAEEAPPPAKSGGDDPRETGPKREEENR